MRVSLFWSEIFCDPSTTNIFFFNLGASEINISCVIDGSDATRAMNVLHTHLFTFLE